MADAFLHDAVSSSGGLRKVTFFFYHLVGPHGPNVDFSESSTTIYLFKTMAEAPLFPNCRKVFFIYLLLIHYMAEAILQNNARGEAVLENFVGMQKYAKSEVTESPNGVCLDVLTDQ